MKTYSVHRGIRSTHTTDGSQQSLDQNLWGSGHTHLHDSAAILGIRRLLVSPVGSRGNPLLYLVREDQVAMQVKADRPLSRTILFTYRLTPCMFTTLVRVTVASL
jgi:hypothetical protein